MTNGEKYKTAKERNEAYALYCESMRSSNLAILHNTFEWLELEYDVALKVCPFCGSAAQIIDLNDDEFQYYYVRCTNCKCKIDPCLGKHVAIAAWNRRAK